MPLDLDALAKSGKVSKDTLRRLRYPMYEQTQPDGTVKFVHDPGVRRGQAALISSLRVDRGQGVVSETLLREEQAATGNPNSEDFEGVSEAHTAAQGPSRDPDTGRFVSAKEDA